jgi:hypothetical protein
MENLKKVGINFEIIIKPEELILLKGGVNATKTCVTCIMWDLSEQSLGNFIGCPTVWEAAEMCLALYSETSTTRFSCGVSC